MILAIPNGNARRVAVLIFGGEMTEETQVVKNEETEVQPVSETPQAGVETEDTQEVSPEIKKLRNEAQNLRQRLKAAQEDIKQIGQLQEKLQMIEREMEERTVQANLAFAALREGVDISPIVGYLDYSRLTKADTDKLIKAIKEISRPALSAPAISPTIPPKTESALTLDEIKTWSIDQIRARWGEVQEVLKRR